MTNYTPVSKNELYHYGVPGMRWGVRREARVVANVTAHVMLAKVVSLGGSKARKALKNTGNKRLERVGSLVNFGAKTASIAIIATGALKVKELVQEDEPRGTANE